MQIPNKILEIFIKESEGLEYGKVTLGLVVRDQHVHFEVDKHLTIMADGIFISKENGNEKKGD